MVEDRDTILELTGKIQELRKLIVRKIQEIFQDAESVRSGNSHVTSRPVSFPPHPMPEGMLRHSFGVPSRREGPPSIWDTHGISGNVFADPHASSSAPYPQELHQWNSSEEPLHSSTVEKSERPEQNQDLAEPQTHGKSGNVFANPAASSSAPYPQELNPRSSNVSEHTSPHVMSESQTPVQDQRCQSGPSARNSVILSEGGCSKNYGADQQQLQISDPHFDKFPTPATFAFLEDQIQD